MTETKITLYLNRDRFLTRVQDEKLERSRLAVRCQESEVDELLRTVDSGLGGNLDLERKVEKFGAGRVRFDPKNGVIHLHPT